jgi:mannitol/fructose-specific phosphotransferase system IIA component (Ntr-type)
MPRSLWERLRGKTGIVDRLIHEAKGVTLTVLDTHEEELPKVHVPMESEEIPAAAPSVSETVNRWSLPQLLSSERIVIWNEPVGKEVVLRRLVEKVEQRGGVWDSTRFLNAILEREKYGSTFFNEGAAFPHARIDGLTHSIVSLGLTRQGVSDEPTEKPVELVFLILSPVENPDEQIKILALASRASQDRYFRQNLQPCRTPEEVMAAIRNWNWKEEGRTT